MAISELVRGAALAAMLGAGITAQASDAAAQDQLGPIGDLTCSIGRAVETPAPPSSDGEQIGPAKGQELICSFRAHAGGAEEVYTGTAYGAGDGIGTPGPGSLVWVVRGPSTLELGPGLLTRKYTAQSGGQADKTPVPLIAEDMESLSLLPFADPPQAEVKSNGQPASPATTGSQGVTSLDLKLKASAT